MAQLVGKYAANKLLKKQMAKYESKKVTGGEDPYFAMIEDPRKPGKLKKVKKQVPSYIPEHDAAILASVRRRAYHLDCSLFSLFGMRFGWESVIGIIPVAGDVIGVALALMIVKKARTIEGGLAQGVLIQMLINVALDFLVGLIPFLGDLADAAFKANTKNLRLLEEVLDKKYKPSELKTDPRNTPGLDPQTRKQNRKSGIYHPMDPPPATAWEDSDVEEEYRPHGNGVQAAPAGGRQPGFGPGGQAAPMMDGANRAPPQDRRAQQSQPMR
ncbi:unnamed protein product [Zymoseptoria tritici ST99CH_3D1]|uniref:PH domain-containing protein n=2 Tax=Zymoseptoria tritici TaxID=1047171 RepID=F9X363_ZYMTI|nr:uncharacterized protein MYCGRDRAFT_36120 [Zymoseptoria tritici IPO323]EGP90114.1 hypothetical protein MYCGRDRAFT_36120 [Zymoseptoria tritici IPO323]SMR46609.1 unnamed protein product [Zymoseptoria tritici ST99CH_1E4]SMR47850.1 unnamed protein product [Zymoseptoria tritici ST99CH_3D1]